MSRFALAAALVLLSRAAAFGLDVPALSGRVNDYGEMMSAAAETEIARKLGL